MKKILLIGLLFLVVGCGGEQLARKEIIDGVKECEAGGLEAHIRTNFWSIKQTEVICYKSRY